MVTYIAAGTSVPATTIYVWMGLGVVLFVLVFLSLTGAPIFIAGGTLLTIGVLAALGVFPGLVLGATSIIGIPLLWILGGHSFFGS